MIRDAIVYWLSFTGILFKKEELYKDEVNLYLYKYVLVDRNKANKISCIYNLKLDTELL